MLFMLVLILFNMITGFVAGSETVYDNVGGGAIVTREGTGICVFVGADLPEIYPNIVLF